MTNQTTGRAHLALNPTRTAEADYQESVDRYLADQKEQKALSRGGRDYLDIDEAYDLGVGVQSTWYEPGASTEASIHRQGDLKYKAQLDHLKSINALSDAAYQQGLREAGFLPEDVVNDSPASGLEPLQYDTETSNNAQWTIGQVGQGAFNNALTSYVMGDSTAAMNLANQLQEHGVTPNDITGMYDSMAQTAAGKIAAVMDANGDHDVSVNEVIEWARSLEPGQQVFHLTRTAMASALFDNFQHVPEVVQAYRIAKRKPR